MDMRQQTDPVARRITDPLELDEWVPPAERPHHDQYAHFTHELAEESSEASARILVRLVPLAYGILLGVLGDRLALGLSAGIALALAFDLFMGTNSLARGLYRQVRNCCGNGRQA